jgi:hypothetical protein
MGKQMVRCAREDRATVPSAMIHLLPCTVDHGRFVSSCQQPGVPPKIRDGQVFGKTPLAHVPCTRWMIISGSFFCDGRIMVGIVKAFESYFRIN